MPCVDCAGPCDAWPPGVKLGTATPVAIVCDVESCKNYVSSGSTVCYLPLTPVVESVELPVVGDDWNVISPTEATQTYTAPDGTVITYTVTRISGNGTLASGGSLYGRKTVQLEAQDGAPTRWQLSWDTPSQGPVQIAFGNIDTAGGEVLDNWSATPNNIGVLDPAEDGQEHVFEWWTALVDPVNSVQFDFTGTAIGDILNFGPFMMWFEQETYYIREAFIFWDNSATAGEPCADIPTPVLFDTKTNEAVDPSQIVGCDSEPFSWTVVLCDETGTEFQRVFHKDSGRINVQDHTFGSDGETYIPIGNVSFCVPKQWCTTLCINEPNVLGFDVYTFDFDTEEVKRVNGLTGDTLESHNPVGVDWGFGSIYDGAGSLYLFDSIAGEWHVYNTNNISAGSTNLGVFGGDVIANIPNFGAFDPVNNVGYIGLDTVDRYEVDFNTMTVTSLPAITGIPAGWSVSSLSVTPNGTQYVAAIQYPVTGPNTQLYTLDSATGIATLVDTIPGPAINGHDFDLDNETGWYGVDNTTDTMYFWTKPDGSDFKAVATSPGLSSPTITVGAALVEYIKTPFERCFSTNSVGDIDITNYELDGDPLTIENEGWVGVCDTTDETDCHVPGPKLCYSKSTVTDEELSFANVEWEIVNPTLATLTVPYGSTTITFTATATGATTFGGVPSYAGNGSALHLENGSDGFELTWDGELSAVEFIMAVYDIDTALNGIVPAPDNGPAIGNNVLSEYRWNDGSAIDGTTGINFDFVADPDGVDLILGSSVTFPVTVVSEVVESAELITFFNCDGSLIEYRDAVTDEVVTDPTIIVCTETDIEIMVGYIEECDRFDNTLPINFEGTFNAGATINTVSFASNSVVANIRAEIVRAQDVEKQELKHGLAVTNFVFNTSSGQVYSFRPSAYIVGTGTTISIDNTVAGLSWGIDQTDNVEQIVYSTLDNCVCTPVKMIEYIDSDNISYLIDVVRTSDYDSVTRIEPSILDGAGLLPFGVRGPYPGLCPDDIQVINLDELCCNDDLVSGASEIANHRIAWLDAADTLSNLLDSIGGTPIAGNDGDIVGQVLDKIGGTNTFDDGGGPNGGAYYRLNSLNSLPGLQFDGSGGAQGLNIADHYEIQLGAGIAIGSPFQVFYLLKGTDPNAAENACFLACGPNAGGQFAGQQSTWQISRGETPQGTPNQFVFRYHNGVTSVDIPLIPWAQFSNGQPHLITLFYDGTNVNVYIDGDQLLSFVPTVGLYSQFFRIFGNRQDTSYPEGELYEMFISDGTLDLDQIATINAYMICKWGIDPSSVVGGYGDLVLAPAGSYDAPSPFVRVVYADGIVRYINTYNGQKFVVPPVPGLSICGSSSGTCDYCVVGNVTVVDDVVTANYTIPAGTYSYSIAIESGVAVINGATRPTGYVISQSPQSFGDSKLLYPAVNITGVTGTVHINYVSP